VPPGIAHPRARKRGGKTGFDGGGDKPADTETSQSYEDTSEARFERFIKLSAQNPERSGWVDVGDPDEDLAAVVSGNVLEFDCELFVPPMIRSLTSSGGIGNAISMMKALGPLVNTINPGSMELPADDQMQAISAMSSLMGDDLVVVGERDETDWRVAGRLISQHIRDAELDGTARIVGKVSARVADGEHKSLLALPGMNLMTREQRRAQAKSGPNAGDEANWVSGPALMLDILAVYR
jgi:hypothetical protein